MVLPRGLAGITAVCVTPLITKVRVSPAPAAPVVKVMRWISPKGAPSKLKVDGTNEVNSCVWAPVPTLGLVIATPVDPASVYKSGRF